MTAPRGDGGTGDGRAGRIAHHHTEVACPGGAADEKEEQGRAVHFLNFSGFKLELTLADFSSNSSEVLPPVLRGHQLGNQQAAKLLVVGETKLELHFDRLRACRPSWAALPCDPWAVDR